MHVIMMGTGPYAVPTFQSLYERKHSVKALVTRPPRPVHGKQRAPANPMRQVAEAHQTPVLMPENVNREEFRKTLAALSPDLLVVCDYGQILRTETLAVARFGGINLHASLLPKYRGAAPINWAIYHGESETGNTVIHMTPRMDAGPAIAQDRTAIFPEETASLLEERLSRMGADLVCAAIEQIAAGEIVAVAQDPRQASKAPRLKKSDGLVDWSRTAEQIKNQVRAMQPWPTTFTFWRRESHEPLRLILHEVTVGAHTKDAAPGEVVAVEDTIVVAAGQATIAIHALQPAGKRALSAREFLHGYHLCPGDRLG